MLTALSIDNYALIEHLDVSFDTGMTSITGETGAGKSILLGALSLILGKRADRSTLKDASKKCIIEAHFDIVAYGLQSFFEKESLDYSSDTIVRREIVPSGKSRAFINDSPVNLDVLERLGAHLIDIHSQHQTLELIKSDYQFQVLDALAGNTEMLHQYQSVLTAYKKDEKDLSLLRQSLSQAKKNRDYNQFLFDELVAADLQSDMLAPLEARVDELSSVQDIQQSLMGGIQLIEAEDVGLLHALGQLRLELKTATQKSKELKDLPSRLESLIAELNDIHSDLQFKQGSLESDPEALIEAENKLQNLYDLFKKHQVNSVQGLIVVRDHLATQLEDTDQQQERINTLELAVQQAEEKLTQLASALSEGRKKTRVDLIEKLEELVCRLGIQNAQFGIHLTPSDTFLSNGKDQMEFLFTANLGTQLGPLKNVASGGELSRIMLSIKALLSRYKKLPTIIFDEIDTGVSGAVSEEIAQLMTQMALDMQVFAITHLPQVAAKGSQHFKVYKTIYNAGTQTQIKELNKEERIAEIAKMVSGKELTPTALEHAKELLN
ncbi:MAG: DNA repair protein RecN [Flavobacteriaceae bacterium]